MSYPAGALQVLEGTTSEYVSPVGAHRHFCSRCGSGLFYFNQEFLPDLVDIQLTTLDDCDRMVPQFHLQTADELPWEKSLDQLPRFERYPDSLVHYH